MVSEEEEGRRRRTSPSPSPGMVLCGGDERCDEVEARVGCL